MALLLLAGCSHAGSETGKADTMPVVKVDTAQMYAPTGGAVYSASVNAAREMDVNFKGAGYVDSVYTVTGGGITRPAQAGDIVRKGVVLARLRQADYIARVHEAQAAANEVA